MKYGALLALLLFLGACSGTRALDKKYSRTTRKAVKESPVFSRSQTGFVLLDPANGKVLCNVNGDKYFTPASNTKILTLYASLVLLGDSIPRLRYGFTPNRQLLVQGTGDPSWLNPLFNAWQPVSAFFQEPKAVLTRLPGAATLPRWGAGWCWDDFSEDYSLEISDLPLYGHLRSLTRKYGRWQPYTAVPPLPQGVLKVSADVQSPQRDALSDTIFTPARLPLEGEETVQIPVFQPRKQVTRWLRDSLHWPVQERDSTLVLRGKWYVTPVDTVYRRMMHESDNFVAEQLLVLCAGEKFDTLSTSKLLRWAKDSLLAFLPQPLRWVDGSGLSRYNQNTPMNFALILQKLWQKIPEKRLFDLFPAGGRSGTIARWCAGKNGQPYVFAKTGSMSGVLCMSGYVVTRHGRTLVFSFMHNQFLGSNKDWRMEMQQLLEQIRDL
jgi:serine-type D-Ala-D-Ala carboxypeptidase/endopeptidase (penicillin-binding protein 4)